MVETRLMLKWTKTRCKCLSRDILNFQMNLNIERVKVEHICNYEKSWHRKVITTQVQSISIVPWKSQKKLAMLTPRSKRRLILVWLTHPLNGTIILMGYYLRSRDKTMIWTEWITKKWKTKIKSTKQPVKRKKTDENKIIF